MKPILRIARTELQKLFYSPIAWLVIIIFTFQAGMSFTEIYDMWFQNQRMNYPIDPVTTNLFSRTFSGWFASIQRYFYLYIPLLTMNYFSREFSSGAIKLLYSSPLTNFQIVMGKYLSLLLFALVLTGIISIFCVYGGLTIEKADIALIASGVLGLYLLISTYAAIGLFMSSLTSYPIVAAITTLATLSFFTYVATMGQETELVRDITYWLSINGRTATFIRGLITTEDVLYFVVLISLFLSFTILKLTGVRHHRTSSGQAIRYSTVFLVAMAIGYFSDKPALKGFLDVTRNKTNTLTRSSKAVVDKLTDGLTITTYTNMLTSTYFFTSPQTQKIDVDKFQLYTQFKPGIRMKYKYYYHRSDYPELDQAYPGLTDKQLMDTIQKIGNFKFRILPYNDLAREADLASEEYRNVRLLETDSGKRTFLRFYDDPMRDPFEAQISAAFKRLTDKLPVVGFVTGHGERESHNRFDRGYRKFTQEKSFRYSLINQGFDFEDMPLTNPIPAHIRILVIADPRKKLSETESNHLNAYINRGGNLLIAGEPGREAIMNTITAPLGVQFEPGILVKPTDKFQPELLVLKTTREAADISYFFGDSRTNNMKVVFAGANGLSLFHDRGFKVIPLYQSDSTGSWNEKETKDIEQDTVLFNAAVETQRSHPVAAALQRQINGRSQKIVITGDADWLSNSELSIFRKGIEQTGNLWIIQGIFYWLSDGEAPIDMRRDPPLDKKFLISEDAWSVVNILLTWVLPALLVLGGLFMWIRRRGR